MSPNMFNGRAVMGLVEENGRLNGAVVNETHAIRPVINIDGSVVVSGNGDKNNPYILK